jgi:hypothetical protein
MKGSEEVSDVTITSDDGNQIQANKKSLVIIILHHAI